MHRQRNSHHYIEAAQKDGWRSIKNRNRNGNVREPKRNKKIKAKERNNINKYTHKQAKQRIIQERVKEKKDQAKPECKRSALCDKYE